MRAVGFFVLLFKFQACGWLDTIIRRMLPASTNNDEQLSGTAKQMCLGEIGGQLCLDSDNYPIVMLWSRGWKLQKLVRMTMITRQVALGG